MFVRKRTIVKESNLSPFNKANPNNDSFCNEEEDKNNETKSAHKNNKTSDKISHKNE